MTAALPVEHKAEALRDTRKLRRTDRRELAHTATVRDSTRMVSRGAGSPCARRLSI